MTETEEFSKSADVKYDPSLWAEQPKIYCEKVRQLLSARDWNVNFLILGEVLYRMTGDDRNIFNNYNSPDYKWREAKKKLAKRLEWELETPETPREIKEWINQFGESIKGLNWIDISQRKIIYNSWEELSLKVSTAIHSQEADKGIWLEALRYRNENRDKVLEEIKLREKKS
jgi:hypothetical protein